MQDLTPLMFITAAETPPARNRSRETHGWSSVLAVGYAFGSVDEMGDGVFRKVRQELGVTAFGANVLVLAPGVDARPHYHEEQDELYFVHAGRARFALPGESRELGPGGLCHVESTTPRQITSVGDETLVLLVVGAKDGYVGRDGRPADPSKLGGLDET